MTEKKTSTIPATFSDIHGWSREIDPRTGIGCIRHPLYPPASNDTPETRGKTAHHDTLTQTQDDYNIMLQMVRVSTDECGLLRMKAFKQRPDYDPSKPLLETMKLNTLREFGEVMATLGRGADADSTMRYLMEHVIPQQPERTTYLNGITRDKIEASVREGVEHVFQTRQHISTDQATHHAPTTPQRER